MYICTVANTFKKLNHTMHKVIDSKTQRIENYLLYALFLSFTPLLINFLNNKNI